MKAEDYRHVVSASGEPPLAENIILDGNVMPLRNDPKDKIRLRGEDICFLFESGARFDRVDFGTASVREFTRKVKASQAQAALEEITRMFQSGYALKSLPKAGEVFVLEDKNDYMAPFDVLTVDDCEPMEPEPQVGGKILAAPFQAAFRNFEKVKGRGKDYSVPVSEHPEYGVVVYEQKYWDQVEVEGAGSNSIYYYNLGMGPFYAPTKPEHEGQSEYIPTYIRGLSSPAQSPSEVSLIYAPDYWLDGCKCLGGTIWSVDMYRRIDYTGQDGVHGYVLVMNDEWEDEKITFPGFSINNAMNILNVVCNKIDSAMWADALQSYTDLPLREIREYTVTASADSVVGIVATPNCLREGFN